MPNIRLNLQSPIVDGQSITFRSPADCSQVTGLSVYFPDDSESEAGTGLSSPALFLFADAHGNNVGGKDLFASSVLVKVILDIATMLAYVQNADTNAYLESKFDSLDTSVSSLNNNFSNLDASVQGKQKKHTPVQVTLKADAWDSNMKTQRVTVTGVDENCTVIISPEASSLTGYPAWCKSAVRCYSQLTDTLSFVCDEIPTSDILVNVVILSHQ